MIPEVIKSKKGIIIRTCGDRWVELSQEGDCSGIKSGDKFTLNGVEEMVIGFSNDQNTADVPFSLIWTLAKGEKRAGFWNKGGTIEKLKLSIRKAEKAMTADTTEEEIMNFLNG